MVRKTYTPEQIINKLREAEIHINQGIPIAEASRREEGYGLMTVLVSG